VVDMGRYKLYLPLFIKILRKGKNTMEKLRASMELGIATFVAILADVDWFLVYIYVFFMILDLITGCYKATKNGDYKSSKMKEGLKGKVIELFIVFALLFIQRAFEEFGILIFASNFILFGFALKEFMSIMENWFEAGHTIPEFVSKWLKTASDTFEVKTNEILNKEEKKEDEDK
jgi:toxin secretion/phage lysis holin